MSNGSKVMIYLSFLLSEFIATRRARLEAREAGFLVHNIIKLVGCSNSWDFLNTNIDMAYLNNRTVCQLHTTINMTATGDQTISEVFICLKLTLFPVFPSDKPRQLCTLSLDKP